MRNLVQPIIRQYHFANSAKILRGVGKCEWMKCHVGGWEWKGRRRRKTIGGVVENACATLYIYIGCACMTVTGRRIGRSIDYLRLRGFGSVLRQTSKRTCWSSRADKIVTDLATIHTSTRLIVSPFELEACPWRRWKTWVILLFIFTYWFIFLYFFLYQISFSFQNHLLWAYIIFTIASIVINIVSKVYIITNLKLLLRRNWFLNFDDS